MADSMVLNYLLPFVAIFISICSLGFSIFHTRKTIRLTQKHYLNSVEPLLETIYVRNFSEDKKYLTQTLEIENCGLGPAKINTLSFMIDGEIYDDIVNLYDSKLGLPPKYEKFGARFLANDAVMAPNDKIKLFEFYYSYATDEDSFSYYPEGVDELFERISLNCKYETIYGGKRSLYLKSLLPR